MPSLRSGITLGLGLCIHPYRYASQLVRTYEYLARTQELRKGRSQLLISYVKPHAPVSKSTIAHWCKVVLGKAGIDITVFGAHILQSASTSEAKRKGLPVEIIMSAAGWSNESTFERFTIKNWTILLTLDKLYCDKYLHEYCWMLINCLLSLVLYDSNVCFVA